MCRLVLCYIKEHVNIYLTIFKELYGGTYQSDTHKKK